MMRRVLSLDVAWCALPLGFAVIWCFLTPVEPGDFWLQVGWGRHIVTERGVPSTDPFCFSQPDAPYSHQAWLAAVCFYLLFQAGGVPLLLVVHALLLAAAVALLLSATARRCRSLPLAAALLFLAIPLVGNNWNVRAQSFAIPMFCAFVAIVERFRATGRGPLWVLPLLMLFWANMHGSFVLGLVMLGILLFTELPWWPARLRALLPGALDAAAWRRLLIAAAATLLATLANPVGPRIYGIVGGLSTNPVVTSRIVEWQPITNRTAYGAVVFGYLAVVLFSMAVSTRRPRAADLALIAVFAWLGLSIVRAVMWLVYVSLPIWAETLGQLLPQRERPRDSGPPALNAALLGMLLAAMALCSPWTKERLPLDERMRPLLAPQTPVAAVEFIRAETDRPARLFHTMEYGGYLMWALPELPVFVDPRIEFYSTAIWKDYLSIVDDRDALQVIDRWGFDGLLLPTSEQADLIRTVRQSGRWTVRYEDECATYFRAAG